jgi:hypothetical protein
MKTKTSFLLAAASVAAVSLPLQTAIAGSTNEPVTAESLRQGLVLHLSFDRDESGGKVADTSGLGNHGKASGVHWTADGKKGGAYEFTADGQEIVVANHASLNPKQLTLSAWIKTRTEDAQWRRIFDKSYSKGFALGMAGEWQGNVWNGRISLEVGPGTHFSLTKSKVADGQWHHIVATFDGTEQLLFVDGKPDAKPLHWKGAAGVGATDFNLVIGCNRSNLDEDDLGVSFRGLIDEPMMWNRALSLKEVEFLFESQR